MISNREKLKIIKVAMKYNPSSIYLFGSSLDENNRTRDIDLGVKGINPKLFFKFYGELIQTLSKPVDLVDLSKKSKFNKTVEKNGVKIYG